jgi:hypothetical protein
VLLRFFGDDGKEKRLLPCGRLAGAIKPSVGRLPWTTQSGYDHGGRIRGERISEGHGQILPQKKKYAMQKINLDKCPQCRQSLRMTNAEYISDAKSLMAVADHCSTTAAQAHQLYTQASRILRACPKSTNWRENVRISNLIQEAEQYASL